MSSLLFNTCEGSWTVEGARLDEILARFHAEDCAFIKMDIEGGEYVVLPSMAPWLIHHRPTLYLSLHPFYLLLSKTRGDRPASRYARAIIRRAFSEKRIPPPVEYAARAFLKLFAFGTTLWLLRFFRKYKHIYDDQGHNLTYWRLLRISNDALAVVVSDRLWPRAW